MGKDLLLHTCCAPCLLYPYKRLTEMGYNVISYWYNPNIYPVMERAIRFNELKRYCQERNIKFIYDTSPSNDFYKAIFPHYQPPQRCSNCWKLRLSMAAKRAKEEGINVFTTTLLVSKYQDPKEINRLGKCIEEQTGVKYLEADFRDGFEWAHHRAKEMEMYRQKWCGCIYSFTTRTQALIKRGKFKKII